MYGICELQYTCMHTSKTDVRAFQALYDATGGSTSWTHCKDFRDDPCSCPDVLDSLEKRVVSCNPYTGRIRRLRLANSGLRGTIPPELSLAEDLVLLDLSSNELHGRMPSSNSCFSSQQGERLDFCDLSAFGMDSVTKLPGCRNKKMAYIDADLRHRLHRNSSLPMRVLTFKFLLREVSLSVATTQAARLVCIMYILYT